MKQDLFRYLPSEIITDILLRLPPQTIATCKCVCKPWLNLTETDNFLKSHISKSAPALVVSMPSLDSNRFNVFELDNYLLPMTDSNWFKFCDSQVEHKQDPITEFDIPQRLSIRGSASGLLLLNYSSCSYVCNPITREFVELRAPLNFSRWVNYYGFGVSKISGQHKVVYLDPVNGCRVLTLETGSSWRSVTPPLARFEWRLSPGGAFVNGCLHWLVSYRREIPYFCCFDVETECFSTFSAPMDAKRRGYYFNWKFCSLGDFLCFWDDEPYDKEIWLLKENEQVEKHWSKVSLKQPFKGLFALNPRLACVEEEYPDIFIQPIKVYKNGDMLMLWDAGRFVYYSYKRKNVRHIDLFGKKDNKCLLIEPILLTPSFLSLKRNLGMENVISF